MEHLLLYYPEQEHDNNEISGLKLQLDDLKKITKQQDKEYKKSKLNYIVKTNNYQQEKQKFKRLKLAYDKLLTEYDKLTEEKCDIRTKYDTLSVMYRALPSEFNRNIKMLREKLKEQYNNTWNNTVYQCYHTLTKQRNGNRILLNRLPEWNSMILEYEGKIKAIESENKIIENITIRLRYEYMTELMKLENHMRDTLNVAITKHTLTMDKQLEDLKMVRNLLREIYTAKRFKLLKDQTKLNNIQTEIINLNEKLAKMKKLISQKESPSSMLDKL